MSLRFKMINKIFPLVLYEKKYFSYQKMFVQIIAKVISMSKHKNPKIFGNCQTNLADPILKSICLKFGILECVDVVGMIRKKNQIKSNHHSKAEIISKPTFPSQF